MKLFYGLAFILMFCMSPAARSQGGREIFVKAELDRQSAYPGQQATLAYRFYCISRIEVVPQGIQLLESPPLSGFWVEDLDVEQYPISERRVVEGREYQTFIGKKQALFATTTGKAKIPSSTFAISARDLFEVPASVHTVNLQSPEIFLEVKPLPAAKRPHDFSNVAGSFKLSAATDKTEAARGDAVALRVKLEGRGNLKMIPDIPMPPIPGFSVSSSKRTDKIRLLTENQLGGEILWEHVLVSHAPGSQTIPSISFSYFNAGQDRYETVATLPLSIKVTSGADSPPAFSGLSENEQQKLMQELIRRENDIGFLKQSAGSPNNNKRPLHQNPWLYLAAALALAFIAGAFFYQKRRSRLSVSGAARTRRARRNALKQLLIAEKDSRSDARRYYDRAAAALSGYLSESFNLAEIELTSDTLDRVLSGNYAPPEIIEETRACLQECDFGRFVSASNAADKKAALSARIRKVIDALENIAAEKDSNS